MDRRAHVYIAPATTGGGRSVSGSKGAMLLPVEESPHVLSKATAWPVPGRAAGAVEAAAVESASFGSHDSGPRAVFSTDTFPEGNVQQPAALQGWSTMLNQSGSTTAAGGEAGSVAGGGAAAVRGGEEQGGISAAAEDRVQDALIWLDLEMTGEVLKVLLSGSAQYPHPCPAILVICSMLLAPHDESSYENMLPIFGQNYLVMRLRSAFRV